MFPSTETYMFKVSPWYMIGETMILTDCVCWQLVLEQLRGASLLEKLSNCWDELQADVDHLLDKDLNKATSASSCIGLKQVSAIAKYTFKIISMI